jgi:excisionase family DNA binding protein
MSGQLFINGQRHVTAAEAARESGLTRDYLSKLAKAGKIPGCRLGNIWLLDCQAVRSFMNENKRSRAQRRAKLSQMRVSEYRTAENSRAGANRR